VVAARHHHHDVWDQLEELGWKCVPEIMSLFERLKKVIDTAEEFRTLDAIYEAMPRQNFSSHILQRVPEQLAVGDAGCPLE
jgi:mannose-1-phosphate guanylyltransferase